MKKVSFTALLTGTAAVFFFISIYSAGTERGDTAASGDFCGNLKKIIASAQNSFDGIRGEETIRVLMGRERKFFFCTVDMHETNRGYINTSESYPQYSVFFETEEKPLISEKIRVKYAEVSKSLRECLAESDWDIREYDASNSSFLEGTEHKKLVAEQKKANADSKKVTVTLFMYRWGNETMRVVELQVDGIGKSKY